MISQPASSKVSLTFYECVMWPNRARLSNTVNVWGAVTVVQLIAYINSSFYVNKVSVYK